MTGTPQIEQAWQLSPSRFRTTHDPLPSWKRVLDLTLLVLFAPVVLPLMAITALIIRISSTGPILFRQERIGLYGQPFTCLKFRTMHLAGGTEPHQEHLASLMTNGQPMTKLDLNDGRIIPFGMLIRAMALDELPQLFNILRGEMSLVGPRPCLSYEQQRFKAEHAARFDGMPGLTGLWQVSGKNETTFQEMIRLDVEYIRTLSLWRDLRILVLTLPVLISQTAVVLQNKWQRVTKARRHGMRCN